MRNLYGGSTRRAARELCSARPRVSSMKRLYISRREHLIGKERVVVYLISDRGPRRASPKPLYKASPPSSLPDPSSRSIAGRTAPCYGRRTSSRAAMSSRSQRSSSPRDACIKNRLEHSSPGVGVRRADGSDRLPLRSLAFFRRIDTMIHDLHRIQIELIPLTLFPRASGEAWPWAPGSPLHRPPDIASRPSTDLEAHLMMFSVMPRTTMECPWGQALHAWRSAFILYVTGTQFDLFCYSAGLVRLLDDFGNLTPSAISVSMH